MEMIRSFVALNLPLSTVNAAAQTQREMRRQLEGQGVRLGWVPAANLHVTLKFLGSVPRANVRAATAALECAASQHAPLSLRVGEIGTFPAEGEARVLWLGVHSEDDALHALVQSIEVEMEHAGFEPESRPFHAHLTLGRAKEGALGDCIATCGQPDLGLCLARELALYESVRLRQYSEYRVLGSWLLGESAGTSSLQEAQT